MAVEIKTDTLNRVEYQGTTLKEFQFNGNSLWPRETVVTATLTGTVAYVDLFNWIRDNTSWDGSTVVRATVNVGTSSAAARINARATGGIALACNLSNFPAGSRIEVIWRNTVNVRGGGGNGGGQVQGSNGTAGQNGGDAIRITGSGSTLILNFNGRSGQVVRGAGGGGYLLGSFGAGTQPARSYLIGGGGGAGTPIGRGGPATGANNNFPGNDATETTGGEGIAQVIGRSGDGGSSPLTGTASGDGTRAVAGSAIGPVVGAAGSAGWAIRGRNRVTIQGDQNVRIVGTSGNN